MADSSAPDFAVIRRELEKVYPESSIEEIKEFMSTTDKKREFSPLCFEELSQVVAIAESRVPDFAVIRRELAKVYPESSIERIKKFMSTRKKKHEYHPLFFEALIHGVSTSIIWEQKDLEHLLKAIGDRSIGQQTVIGNEGSSIPKVFRDNEVRIVEWAFPDGGLIQSDHEYLSEQKRHVEKLEISIGSDGDIIPSLENLRELYVRRRRNSAYIFPPLSCPQNLELFCASDVRWNFDLPLPKLQSLHLHSCELNSSTEEIAELDLTPLANLKSVKIYHCDISVYTHLILPESVSDFDLRMCEPEWMMPLECVCLRKCSALNSIVLAGCFPDLTRVITYSNIPALDDSDIAAFNGAGSIEWRRGLWSDRWSITEVFFNPF